MFSFTLIALGIGIFSGAIGIMMEKYGVTSYIAYYFLGIGTVVLSNIVSLVLQKKSAKDI